MIMYMRSLTYHPTPSCEKRHRQGERRGERSKWQLVDNNMDGGFGKAYSTFGVAGYYEKTGEQYFNPHRYDI